MTESTPGEHAGIVFRTCPDPILLYRLTEDGVAIENVNHAYETEFTREPERVVSELVTPDELQRRFERRVPRTDGADRLLSNVPIENIDGVDGYLTFEEPHEEENAQRLKELLHTVAHDLRNPLDVAMARREALSSSSDSELLDTMAEAHDRMRTIIDEVLTQARLGTESVDPEPVLLESVARDAWEAVKTDDMDLTVRTDRTVHADRSGLQTLFENLFRNAREHGKAEGEQLRVEVRADEHSFSVSDNGTGFDADDPAELFEPGVTGDNSGTGLGLAIVKSVATAHGWSCTVNAGADGGAEFAFSNVE